MILDRVPIPCEQIHRMRGEDPNPEREAVRHEAAGSRRAGVSPRRAPRFDFAFLGLGIDAHVASLFPGSPALALTDRLVAAVRMDEVAIPDPAVDRLTLTFAALNGANAGPCSSCRARKRRRPCGRCWRIPPTPCSDLRRGIRAGGRISGWLVDRGAASLLSGAPGVIVAAP